MPSDAKSGTNVKISMVAMNEKAVDGNKWLRKKWVRVPCPPPKKRWNFSVPTFFNFKNPTFFRQMQKNRKDC